MSRVGTVAAEAEQSAGPPRHSQGRSCRRIVPDPLPRVRGTQRAGVCLASPVKIVSAVSWSWRALRGHSVTSAGLFASAVLGLSVLSGFHHLLVRVGAPWYVLLLAPIIATGYVARKEQQWIPEPARRRRLARLLFFGSLVLAFALARLRSPPPSAHQAVVRARAR